MFDIALHAPCSLSCAVKKSVETSLFPPKDFPYLTSPHLTSPHLNDNQQPTALITDNARFPAPWPGCIYALDNHQDLPIVVSRRSKFLLRHPAGDSGWSVFQAPRDRGTTGRGNLRWIWCPPPPGTTDCLFCSTGCSLMSSERRPRLPDTRPGPRELPQQLVLVVWEYRRHRRRQFRPGDGWTRCSSRACLHWSGHSNSAEAHRRDCHCHFGA